MTRHSGLLLLILISLAASACAPKPSKEVPEEFKAGQNYFHRVCANCHGADALGGDTKAPNLINRKYLPPDFTDEDIRTTIKKGSISEKMPPQTAFNDAEITEIIKYLRHSQLAAGLKPEIEEEDEDEEEEEDAAPAEKKKAQEKPKAEPAQSSAPPSKT